MSPEFWDTKSLCVKGLVPNLALLVVEWSLMVIFRSLGCALEGESGNQHPLISLSFNDVNSLL